MTEPLREMREIYQANLVTPVIQSKFYCVYLHKQTVLHGLFHMEQLFG